MKFFGKSDMNQHGNIASQIPAWAMRSHIDELEESIASIKRQLDSGTVSFDKIAEKKEALRKYEAKLNQIIEGKPELSDQEANLAYKTRKDLEAEIKESMFTRSDMKLGLASANEEARRMADPIIKITKEQAAICAENNIRVFDVKGSPHLSRDGATQLWKLIGHYFGETTNVETLRRDKATARTGA